MCGSICTPVRGACGTGPTEANAGEAQGTWYYREASNPAGDPGLPQPWRFVGVDALARLIERVRRHPAGCLRPDCAAP
jgi:hypothetical protein